MQSRISKQISTKSSSGAFALLIICGFLFAVKIAISKLALDAGMQPLQLGILGNFASALFLLPILILRKERIAFERQHNALYIALGLISFTLPTVISFLVVTKVGAGYTASVYSLSPLITMSLAAIFGLERLFLRRVIALLLALGCVSVLLRQQYALVDFSQHVWILIGLIIPLCAASGNIIRSAFWPKGSSALSFSFATLITSAAMMMPLTLFFEDASSWQFSGYELLNYFWLFSVISSLSFVLNYRLQAMAGPVFFSQIGSLATGFGVFLGAVLFGESVTILMILALFGIVICSNAARA